MPREPVHRTVIALIHRRIFGQKHAEWQARKGVAGDHRNPLLSGKQPKPCASLFKAKLRLGKHTIHVTATDAAGYTSPAAVARIKVVR